MLVTLIGVTIAAWALTLYQAISMDVPLGVAMRGSMAGHRRTVSVHTAQAHLSPPLSLAACFCCSALARGTDRRAQDGNASRPLLPRMLLGSFQCVSCGRNDEHRLDAVAFAHRIRRKTVSAGGPHFDSHRAGVYCSWTVDVERCHRS